MPNTIGFGVLSLSDVIDVSSAISDLRATADNLHFSLFLAQSCCMEIDYIYGAFLFLCPSPRSLSLYCMDDWGILQTLLFSCRFGIMWRWVNHFFMISQVYAKQHSSSLSTTVLPWTRVVFNTVCHQLNSSLIKHVRSVTLKSALFIVDYVWACSFLLNSALTFWLNVC